MADEVDTEPRGRAFAAGFNGIPQASGSGRPAASLLLLHVMPRERSADAGTRPHADRVHPAMRDYIEPAAKSRERWSWARQDSNLPPDRPENSEKTHT